MKSKIYLKKKLELLSKEFNNISIRYQFDNRDLTHVVEIKPLCEFENNSSYQKVEADISFEFDKLFFPESILFISDDSLTQITKPEFVLESQKLHKTKIELCCQSWVGESTITTVAGNDYNYALAA